MKTPALITLLSDFGDQDGYVAAMKGVILGQAPGVRLVDVAHGIRRHDIRSAAWVLRQCAWTFPAGSCHVAVVDPGVGTDRAALLVEANGHYWIGPDNGIFAWVLKQHAPARLWHIKAGVVRPGGASATFHGRDVFAYAAGLLAKGVRLDRIAEPADSCVEPDWLKPVLQGHTIQGEILHVDHFGNAITNIPATLVADRGPAARIKVGKRILRGIRTTYADVPVGEPLALVGSDGMLEIAVNQGDAGHLLAVTSGSAVLLT